jgi:hypothetical protein
LIVRSNTYRQSSQRRPELAVRDSRNELLGSMPRQRVEAEVVRDISLAAAGLLDRRIGGPSVRPVQPAGASSIVYSGGWEPSKGADRYRRGLYTFIKRTSPFASFMTFDMPTPETACVRRERSNTPLQALTLLNDPAYVDASRGLARRVLAEAGPSPESRADRMFRLCVGRQPRADELERLVGFAIRQAAAFESDREGAAALSGVDASTPDVCERAAWTALARVILNLDETITRD